MGVEVLEGCDGGVDEYGVRGVGGSSKGDGLVVLLVVEEGGQGCQEVRGFCGVRVVEQLKRFAYDTDSGKQRFVSGKE